MLLIPTKHTRISDSLISLGALILGALKEKRSIDSLWSIINASFNTSAYPSRHTYTNFLLTIDYLYSIGAVESDEKGNLYIYAINKS